MLYAAESRFYEQGDDDFEKVGDFVTAFKNLKITGVNPFGLVQLTNLAAFKKIR
jgi:hypothetical protein